MENGIIEQYRGPYQKNSYITLTTKRCKIGFSLDEDDFMKQANPETPNNFYIEIVSLNSLGEESSSQRIELGRTYIYETDDILSPSDKIASSFRIKFPKGAPKSFKLDVLYLTTPKEKDTTNQG